MLERLVLSSPQLDGVILRYGHLYGPGTGASVPREPPTVHVDAAAAAALLRIDRSRPGIYNIAERAATCPRTGLGASSRGIPRFA